MKRFATEFSFAPFCTSKIVDLYYRLTSRSKMERSMSKSEETRERILDAALNIFSSKGYHDTRMDEIVEASDTSKGSIYFYFPNKERLFLALVDQFADLLERRVVEAVEQRGEGHHAGARGAASLSGNLRALPPTGENPAGAGGRLGQRLREEADRGQRPLRRADQEVSGRSRLPSATSPRSIPMSSPMRGWARSTAS